VGSSPPKTARYRTGAPQSARVKAFERLRPNIHSQIPPHQTCCIVGNIVIESIDFGHGEVVVKTNMIMRIHLQRVFAGSGAAPPARSGRIYKIVKKAST
jgi:hypothetical protein